MAQYLAHKKRSKKSTINIVMLPSSQQLFQESITIHIL